MTSITPKEASDEMLCGAVRQILDGRGSQEVVNAVLDEIRRRHGALLAPLAGRGPERANDDEAPALSAEGRQDGAE